MPPTPLTCRVIDCEHRLSRGNVSGLCADHYRVYARTERLIPIGAAPAPERLDEPAIDVRAVARLLDVSTTTIYRLVKADEIPHFRIKRRLRFHPSDVRQWTRQNRADGGSRGSSHDHSAQERKVDRRRLHPRRTSRSAGQPRPNAARGKGVRGGVAGQRLIDVEAVIARQSIR